MNWIKNKPLFWCGLLVLLTIFGIIFSSNVQASSFRWHGLDYDDARNPTDVKQIKIMIDDIAKHKGNYLKLHLSDDTDFAIENDTIGQTTQRYPTMKNGLYYNSQTKKLFMSKQQFSDVVQYGLQKHIIVIPEIDIPSHSVGLHNVLKYTNPELDKKTYDSAYEQFSYGKKATKDMFKTMLQEYLPLIPANTPVGTGGDELAVASKQHKESLLKFDNEIDASLGSHPMWIYNDSAQKQTYKRLNKDIVIEYWSQTGDQDVKAYTKDNIKNNATASQLLKNGHKLVNINSYFLYLLPETSFVTKKNYKYYLKDLNSYFGENIFNESNFYTKVKTSKNIIGSASSIWYDNKPQMTPKQTVKKLMPWVDGFLDWVRKGKLTVK
ncbi:family 20 glycosylhydrolase (plasmid) [Nicoliella spurrieriana]|uniref:beta-N-acetylhexosaminidase n=1 Tax=Nicoliella spurrieriana TaxID=2925830 RepID=A0A976RQL4_9LACO|nr:family 20 glycosylhydrolase [Nicoliella spurrieriana]UQS86003.1 family 20 glycosylhydrolase [Nicoliella spurrieriana]